jgi:hypothetical protein
MATKAHIVVEPRPDGRWARQKNGTQRAASLHDTQAGAERAARAQAKREHTELVVKGKDGRIQRRDSFGNDPRRSKG